MTDTRQPTLEEAVEFVMNSRSIEYRQECVRFWREHFGDQYAECVTREVKKRWAERKSKRNNK